VHGRPVSMLPDIGIMIGDRTIGSLRWSPAFAGMIGGVGERLRSGADYTASGGARPRAG
jgi:hypothetical protein